MWFVWYFLINRLRLCILPRIPQKWYTSLSASYQGIQNVINMSYLLLVMLPLIACLQWCQAGFFSKKLLFLFVINKHLGSETFRLCQYLVFWSTNFCFPHRILPASFYCGTLMVIFYFLLSTFTNWILIKEGCLSFNYIN